ncbi:hypothetical protein COY28_03975, partial [Candidatus Woesearchaeota archaeon CG_4_10_14_0_2_um_filter_57_5]
VTAGDPPANEDYWYAIPYDIGYYGPTDGAHHFCVSAVDAAGNEGAQQCLDITYGASASGDTQAPVASNLA